MCGISSMIPSLFNKRVFFFLLVREGPTRTARTRAMKPCATAAGTTFHPAPLSSLLRSLSPPFLLLTEHVYCPASGRPFSSRSAHPLRHHTERKPVSLTLPTSTWHDPYPPHTSPPIDSHRPPPGTLASYSPLHHAQPSSAPSHSAARRTTTPIAPVGSPSLPRSSRPTHPRATSQNA